MPLPAVDGHFWRRLAAAGAQRGPAWWVRYSPPVFGVLAAALVPDARRSVRRNLRDIQGPKGPLREARDVAETFASYAGCLAEILSAGSKNAARPEVVLVGRKHLDAAHAMKRGIVVTTIHSGGWELVGPLLATYRRSELVMVMEGERDERARELQDDARRKSGLAVAHVGDDPFASLPLLRHLREGDAVALQVDRAPEGMRSVGVTLLGRPYRMPIGPFRLAQVAGAPLVPIFSARTGHRRYDVFAGEPVLLSRRASEAELQQAAQRIADAVTLFLREHPTQWFHFVP